MLFFKNRWSKWEISEENVPMIETYRDYIAGDILYTRNVRIDILKKVNLKTGLVKYKTVKRA